MKETKKILKSLLVLAIVISAVFVLTGCGSNDSSENAEESNTQEAYLEPLTNYFDGIINRDIEQVLKAFPDFMDMGSSITSEDIDDLYTSYESIYGSNIQIEYAFGEATAIEEDELAEIEEEILAIYTDLETIDITAGYTVAVTVTITGDGITSEDSTEETTEEESEEESEEDTSDETTNSDVEESDMYVLEYEGNWYIM